MLQSCFVKFAHLARKSDDTCLNKLSQNPQSTFVAILGDRSTGSTQLSPPSKFVATPVQPAKAQQPSTYRMVAGP